MEQRQAKGMTDGNPLGAQASLPASPERDQALDASIASARLSGVGLSLIEMTLHLCNAGLSRQGCLRSQESSRRIRRHG